MEKGNTKQEILNAALELFSVNGYEATSTARIAEAVGIRKASLYNHFASKQDILDALTETLLREFNERSIYANADWDDPAFTQDKMDMGPAEATAMIKAQISYILHDPHISKVRRMLTIEQFRNEKLRAIHVRQSYENILQYNLGLIRFLIRRGILRDDDPEIMAAQLAWPVSKWTVLCDCEPEREAEAMAFIERHINQFFRVYAG